VPEYLAFGDLGVDSVARVDALPRADDKVWVEPEGDYPGGMVGNCVATIAGLGVSAGVVALVGTDSRGALVRSALDERGVDTRFVRAIEAPTFWTLSLTVASGERALLQFPTPAFGADWEGFDRSQLAGAAWVHTVAEQGEPVGALLADARQAGVRTSLDIEFPYVRREDLYELLPLVDVAFCNSAAADELGGPEDAARKLRAGGAGRVLVTLGSDGALLCDGAGDVSSFAARKVEAIDTNGAGDAFAAAFAAGALRGLEDHECAELATYVAGEATTVLGGFGPRRTVADLRDAVREAGYGWWDRL